MAEKLLEKATDKIRFKRDNYKTEKAYIILAQTFYVVSYLWNITTDADAVICFA